MQDKHQQQVRMPGMRRPGESDALGLPGESDSLDYQNQPVLTQ
jgi:hypothetical protein